MFLERNDWQGLTYKEYRCAYQNKLEAEPRSSEKTIEAVDKFLDEFRDSEVHKKDDSEIRMFLSEEVKLLKEKELEELSKRIEEGLVAPDVFKEAWQREFLSQETHKRLKEFKSSVEASLVNKTEKKLGWWDKLSDQEKKRVVAIAGSGVAAAALVFGIVAWKFGKKKAGDGIKKTKSILGRLWTGVKWTVGISAAAALSYVGITALQKWKLKQELAKLQSKISSLSGEELAKAKARIAKLEIVLSGKEMEEKRSEKADDEERDTNVEDSPSRKEDAIELSKNVVYGHFARGILAFNDNSGIQLEQLQDLLDRNREVKILDIVQGHIQMPSGEGTDEKMRTRAKVFMHSFCKEQRDRCEMTDEDLKDTNLKEFLEIMLKGYISIGMLNDHIGSSGLDLKKIMSFDLMEYVAKDPAISREYEEAVEELYKGGQLPDGWEKINKAKIFSETIKLSAEKGDISLVEFSDWINNAVGKENDPERKILLIVLREVTNHIRSEDSRVHEFMLPLFHGVFVGERENGHSDSDHVRSILLNRMPFSNAVSLFMYHRFIMNGNPAGPILMQAEVLKYLHKEESKKWYAPYYYTQKAMQLAAAKFSSESFDELESQWAETEEERQKISKSLQGSKDLVHKMFSFTFKKGARALMGSIYAGLGGSVASMVNFPKSWLAGSVLGAEIARVIHKFRTPEVNQIVTSLKTNANIASTRRFQGLHRLLGAPNHTDMTTAFEIYEKLHDKVLNSKDVDMLRRLKACESTPHSYPKWKLLVECAESKGATEIADLASEFMEEGNKKLRRAFEHIRKPGGRLNPLPTRTAGRVYSFVRKPITWLEEKASNIFEKLAADESTGFRSKTAPRPTPYEASAPYPEQHRIRTRGATYSDVAKGGDPFAVESAPEASAKPPPAERVSVFRKIRNMRSINKVRGVVQAVKNSALREKLSKSLAAAEQKIAQSKFLRRAGNVGGVVYILMSADMLVDSRKEIEEETNPQVKIQLEQRHNALAQTLIADAAVFGLTPSAAFSTLAGSILGPIAIASTIGYAGNYAYDVRTELAEWSKDASDWSKVPGARTLKEIEETIGEMDSRGRSAGFGTPRVIGWFESQGKTDERIDRIEDHNAGLREEMFRGYFKQTTLASFPKRNDESENQYEARISEMTSDKVVFVEKVTHGDFDSTYNKMLVSADTYAELMSMRKEYEKKGVPAVIEYNALDGSDRNIDLTELDIRSNPEKTREIMGQYKYEYEPLKHLSDIDMANDRRAAAASSLQMKIYVDFVHARNKIPHVEDIQKLRQGALEQASSLLLEEIENRSITIEKYNDYMQKIESIFLAESPGELHESMTKQAIEDMHSREDELGEIANASVESRRHSDEDEKLTPVSDEISAMEKNPDSFVRINGYDPVMQHEGWIVRDVSHTLPIHFFREHTRKDPSNLDGVSGTVVRTSPESTHRFMARKNSGEEIEFSIYDASELDADKNENADLLEHILTTPSDKSLARVVSLFPSEVTSGRSWRMHLLQNIKNMYKSSDKKREFLQQLLGKLRKESAGKGYLSQDDAVSIQSWFIENQDRFSE